VPCLRIKSWRPIGLKALNEARLPDTMFPERGAGLLSNQECQPHFQHHTTVGGPQQSGKRTIIASRAAVGCLTATERTELD